MSHNPQLKAFFLDGFYEEYWASEHEESLSEREAQQVLRLLNAKHGHILDWRGGWGGRCNHYAAVPIDTDSTEQQDDEGKLQAEHF